MKHFSFGIISFLLTSSLFFLSCQSTSPNSSSQKKNDTGRASSIFKIGVKGDPSSFDPRLVRDLETTTTLRLYYDGLMRHNPAGELVPALAEKVKISPDLKTYVFTLREAQWSNGQPITAQDVEASWKSILEPSFPAPNAYQFYLIKNAKEAKEGSLSVDLVGIKAIDEKTLSVELENPTSYFLEMMAFHPFFPVNPQWNGLSTLERSNPHQFIGSGAYLPKTWAHDNVLVSEKNPHYWNANAIKIDRIEMITLDANTALQMYKAGDLDWVGSPLSILPPDAVPALKKKKQLEVVPAAGIGFFRLNTEKGPFDNVKIRQAFSYAIDRALITDHLLQGGQVPAMGIVPKEMGLQKNAFFKDHDLSRAQQLFEEALQEMGISKEQLPQVTISYAQSERNHQLAQAVQEQWIKAFGIDVKLQTTELKVHYERLKNKEYQTCIGSWFADIRDPINFLEVFKSKTNTTNNTGWENPNYIRLLDASTRESDREKRKQLLVEAEEILMDEMPVIPLFYYTFNFVKKPIVEGVYLSDLGYLDFTGARMVNEKIDVVDE